MARGSDVVIRAGDGGGSINIRAGDARDGRDGGSINIRAGDGSAPPANPLLTDPAIHPDLKPLFDAVVMVSVLSSAIDQCYHDLLALRESHGMPKVDEWPDSPGLERNRAQHAEWVKATREEYAAKGESVSVADFLEPRWTERMREWSGYYRDWCAAIATAKQAAKSPAVAAIMDAGESRPAHRWTTQTIIDLDNLAGTLHPIQTGGVDGLGFIRCGLPPLPTNFRTCAEAVGKRIGELRSIAVSAVPERDELRTLAADFADLAKRDATLTARLSEAGEARQVRVLSNDGNAAALRTFRRLAAQAARTLGVARPSRPDGSADDWLAYLFVAGEGLGYVEIEHSDMAELQKEGATETVPFVSRAIRNAAEASALVLRRALAAADTQLPTPREEAERAMPPESGDPVPDDRRPGDWFFHATNELLDPDALRKAATRGTLKRSEKRAGGKWHHSIAEVSRVYSQYADAIAKYAGQSRTKPD